MRPALLLAFVLLTTGCQHHPARLREGKVVPAAMPQAYEQCMAQPELAWCKQNAR